MSDKQRIMELLQMELTIAIENNDEELISQILEIQEKLEKVDIGDPLCFDICSQIHPPKKK